MVMEEYRRWLEQDLEDPDLRPELEAIAGSPEQIEDRFAIDLSFGTAGLRGVLGAGTNRMNIYTVRRATQGLAAYLLGQTPKPSVAVAYDSRIKSDLFAREAASVLAANGIHVWLYDRLQPVPALSFAVRHLKCTAGVMVTASHNPAKYNGYKVYGPDGCQMTTKAAGAVLDAIEKLDIFRDVKTLPFEEAHQAGTIQYISPQVLQRFYERVEAQAVHPGVGKTGGLKLVYTPLNGAGNIPVKKVLQDTGFSDIMVVPEQEQPDGNFPTCPFPNPEVRESLALGLSLAQKAGADLLLATDPDCDRVGIAVRDAQGAYQLLSGNEVGVLLLDYICAGRKAAGTLPEDPVTVRSVVSTPMADVVAQKYGVEMRVVLTGFKYIGEQILRLERQGGEDRFVFGFEESYGYLAGTHVRDKDGVVASMLIAEMAAWHKQQGSSLYEAMQALYDTLGHYLSSVDNFTFEGLSGIQQMENIMQRLRERPLTDIAGLAVATTADYQSHKRSDLSTGSESLIALPAANVLEYVLAGGHSVIVRPSGTEPKIKVYYTTKGRTQQEAGEIRTRLAEAMTPRMK